MTPEETRLLFSHLDRSHSLFLDSINGVTREQWLFIPSMGSWSLGDCAEHVTLVEESVVQRLSGKISADPNPPPPKGPPKVPDELLLKMVSGRAQHVEAPESVRPAARYGEPGALAKRFEQVRSALIEFARRAPANLRSYGMSHPNFQYIDAYQWLLLASGHCERHAKQIQAIKDDPSFPK